MNLPDSVPPTFMRPPPLCLNRRPSPRCPPLCVPDAIRQLDARALPFTLDTTSTRALHTCLP